MSKLEQAKNALYLPNFNFVNFLCDLKPKAIRSESSSTSLFMGGVSFLGAKRGQGCKPRPRTRRMALKFMIPLSFPCCRQLLPPGASKAKENLEAQAFLQARTQFNPTSEGQALLSKKRDEAVCIVVLKQKQLFEAKCKYRMRQSNAF